MKNNYYIYSPILLNKFYYFTINYYCISISADNKNFELISASLLISMYLTIQNLIISFIRDYVPIDNSLYLIQFILSCIPSIIFCISMLLCFIYSIINCQLPLLIFKIITFLLCFGGLWSYNIEEKNSCNCKCECIKGNCSCSCCKINNIKCLCCCQNCNCNCECGELFSQCIQTLLCLNCCKDDDNDSLLI